VDLLIEALSNPFDNSRQALEIMLRTRFVHYVDVSALALVVPIIDYSLRGRNTELKMSACQVVGAISVLLQHPDELMPYIPFLSDSIRMALSDTVPDIRKMASKAIGKISVKIGIERTGQVLAFCEETLRAEAATPLQRLGAANALAEIMCSHGRDYLEEKLWQVLEGLASDRTAVKEGYLHVLFHLPNLLKDQFEGYVQDVIHHVYEFISAEDENQRNIAQQVMQVLIAKYGASQRLKFMDTLKEGAFDTDWHRRNSAGILLGNMLEVFRKHDDCDKEMNEALMIIYCLRTDSVEMVRLTSNQLWANFVDNTVRILRRGMRPLLSVWTECICKPEASVVELCISAFIPKYGETFFE
jgi:hypothetical protein